MTLLSRPQLEKEFRAAQSIAMRLEEDLYTRLAAGVLVGGVIAWGGMVTIALIWIACVFVNELIEPSVVRKLLRTKEASPQRLAAFALHLALGSAIWAGASIALWMTDDPAFMTLGAVLLLGTLMHITLIYAPSKVLVFSVSAPLIGAMGLLTLIVLADDSIAMRDKTVVLFAVLILLAYLVMLLLTNIETQEKMAALYDENARFARQDPLTDLANRRHFVEAIRSAQDLEQPFAIAFIDLDRFKPLNDQYGHAIGDEALIAISRRLEASDHIDFAARLGGDEFGAMINSPDKLEHLGEALHELWQQLVVPIETSIGPISIGASIGCAHAEGSLSDDSKLMHAADVSMIRAKSNGGGVAVFDPSIDEGMLELAELESAFRTAVNSGHLKAALQPIKCVQSQTVKKYELLARWDRTDGGKNLSPSEFSPMAEKFGLLNQILWSTLDQALPKIRGTDLTLALNISPSQLLSASFLDNLEAILRTHLVPNTQIELEITEQVAFRNEKENLAQLERASALGFCIVLDDFGTGYASISLLDQLPLHKVKLDHTFVQSAMKTDHGRKLISAMVGLLKQMQLRCCVEGVEDARTEEFVASLGCEEVQGYLVGRPEFADAAMGAKTTLAV